MIFAKKLCVGFLIFNSVKDLLSKLLQIECHPGLNQNPLIKLCKQYNVIVTAYCPLGRPDPINKLPAFLYDPKVKAIAEQYGKTPAQVVLRYLVCNVNFISQ